MPASSTLRPPHAFLLTRGDALRDESLPVRIDVSNSGPARRGGHVGLQGRRRRRVDHALDERGELIVVHLDGPVLVGGDHLMDMADFAGLLVVEDILLHPFPPVSSTRMFPVPNASRSCIWATLRRNVTVRARPT